MHYANLFSKAGKFNELAHAESRLRHLITFNCYLTGILQSSNVSAIEFQSFAHMRGGKGKGERKI